MLMESWLLEKLGSRERKKDSYAIQHYQSDFCPKVTLKMRVKNYQIILNVYRAQKFYRIFFSSFSHVFLKIWNASDWG